TDGSLREGAPGELRPVRRRPVPETRYAHGLEVAPDEPVRRDERRSNRVFAGAESDPSAVLGDDVVFRPVIDDADTGPAPGTRHFWCRAPHGKAIRNRRTLSDQPLDH